MPKRYTELITSAHNDKRRFVETVELSVSALTQGQDFLGNIPAAFDVDIATGVQLDAVGEWVGCSRFIELPLTDVYFEFDGSDKTGWDSGIWKQIFDVETRGTALDDDTYRRVIKAKIVANHWDGTADKMSTVLHDAFDGKYNVLVIDGQDMSMTVVIAGDKLTALDQALLVGGHLSMKPVGVRINEMDVAIDGGCVFGWDSTDNGVLDGWDTASWATDLLST